MSLLCVCLEKKRHTISSKMPHSPSPLFVQIPLGWTLKFSLDCDQNNSSSNTLTSYPQAWEGFLFMEQFCSTLKFILRTLVENGMTRLLTRILYKILKKKWTWMMKLERQNDNSGSWV